MRAPTHLRPAFVLTVSLMSGGCDPVSGERCIYPQQLFESHNDDCGPNGFTCEKGRWRQNFTYCNPAAPMPAPKAPASPVAAPGSAASPDAAAPGSAASPDAAAPDSAGSPGAAAPDR